MVREFAVNIYLFFFRLTALLCDFFPVSRKKVVIIATFPENNIFLLQEMEKQNSEHDIILICRNEITEQFHYKIIKKKYSLRNINFINPVIIFHLMTSKTVVVDNYFAFLSVVQFSKDVECIQIWHANGAIKKFGAADNSVMYRKQQDVKRLKNVYKKFHKVVVGSDAMGEIFGKAFNLDEGRLLRTGLPRTDLFYDKEMTEEIRKELRSEFVQGNRKLILYAPTYRDNQLGYFDMKLDIEKMYKALNKEYVLAIKLHPAINYSVSFEDEYPNFVYDFSNCKNMNKLLLGTDILITDYSSIPYEFALLKKPMIFFPYDLKNYTAERGLWDTYENLVPGPIAMNTESIIKLITHKEFQIEEIDSYSKKWNVYNQGNASCALVDYINQR